MDNSGVIALPRPRRWDEPMDPLMSDSDVAYLRSRQPFASLDPAAFPRSTPLEGILKNDCRLRRCEPGEVIVREGDYGSSAFLVLSGCVAVVIDSLAGERLGRQEPRPVSWTEALWQFFRPGEFPETRKPEDVVPVQRRTSGSPSGKPDAAAEPGAAAELGEVDGRQTIFLQDFDAVIKAGETVTLGPGELFGEVAAMYRSPRTATVIAEAEATLLEIRWQGLNLLRSDPKFAAELESHYRKQWLPLHLREVPLLGSIPEDRLAAVAAATTLRSCGRVAWNSDHEYLRQLSPREQIENEPLVTDEGRNPTDLIIVRAGFGRLCRRHGDGYLTTAYLGKGQVFGLSEIAFNATRPTDVPPRTVANQLRAVGFLDTLHIPVEVFAADILPYVRREQLPAEISRLMLASTGSKTEALPVAVETESTSLLEFIVQERLNNGRSAMVIDLHRCTRCDDCVTACAANHGGNPRFVRDGVRHDRLQFVQACMQCTDPVCMIGCPTGAIVRDETTGVIGVHEPICVGCGTCASACPYDNIRMVEICDQKGRALTDQKSGKPITKAAKCDLCNDMPSGPACVAACPHDALVRIDLSESHPLERWLDKRS